MEYSLYSQEQAEEIVIEHLDKLVSERKLKQFAIDNDFSYAYIRTYRSWKKQRKLEFTKQLLEKLFNKKVEIIHGFLIID